VQDTKKSLEDGIQKVTDSFVKKLDDMAKAKSEDIMKV
jgi:ribosome recycling factor